MNLRGINNPKQSENAVFINQGVKIAKTEGINNEKRDTRGEKATQIVSTLNLIKQTIPTGIAREIERKHRDLIANFGFLNHNSAIKISKQ